MDAMALLMMMAMDGGRRHRSLAMTSSGVYVFRAEARSGHCLRLWLGVGQDIKISYRMTTTTQGVGGTMRGCFVINRPISTRR